MYLIKLIVLVLLLSNKSISFEKALYDDFFFNCIGKEEASWYDKNGNFIENKYARAVDEYKFSFYSNFEKASDKFHLVTLLNSINGLQRLPVVDPNLKMMKLLGRDVFKNIEVIDTYSEYNDQVFAFGTKHGDQKATIEIDNTISLRTKNYKVSGKMNFHDGYSASFRIVGKCKNLEKLSQYANKYYGNKFNAKNSFSLKNVLGKFLGK